MEIRRSYDRLISTMGFPILARWHLYIEPGPSFFMHMKNSGCWWSGDSTHSSAMTWVRSQNYVCLVTWFCYQLIAKPGNKTATVSWPDPPHAGNIESQWPTKITQCWVYPIISSHNGWPGALHKTSFSEQTSQGYPYYSPALCFPMA